MTPTQEIRRRAIELAVSINSAMPTIDNIVKDATKIADFILAEKEGA